MKKLGMDQRNAIGFQYILDQLEPNTPYGQEIKKKLAPHPREAKQKLEQELDQLQKLVDGMPRVQNKVEELELTLMCMKEVRGSLKKAASMCLGDEEFFTLKNFLIQLDKAEPLYREMSEELQLSLEPLREIREPLDILDPDGRRIPSFYISESYSTRLGEIRQEKKIVELKLRKEEFQKDKKELLLERSEIVAREEEEEQVVRRRLTNELKPYLQSLMRNAEQIGRLDFLLQKAKYTIQEGGVKPVLTETELKLEDMQNPELVHILDRKGKEFAPVSLQMEQGVTVITGANMGGKSVSLRTAVLNIYLVHCGFFAHASKAEVPIFDYLELIAEEFQSMKDGLSSFGGEIVKLRDTLSEVKSGYGFLMIDELARGTNPDEGAQIVRAVVRFLQTQHVMVLLATHYDQVAEYGGSHYQVYGLKRKDMKSLRQEIEAAGKDHGIDIISRYMDYGIYRVTGKEDCPRDAIHVCQLLGLQSEVMDLLD